MKPIVPTPTGCARCVTGTLIDYCDGTFGPIGNCAQALGPLVR
jgi:hypothetical protein